MTLPVFFSFLFFSSWRHSVVMLSAVGGASGAVACQDQKRWHCHLGIMLLAVVMLVSCAAPDSSDIESAICNAQPFTIVPTATRPTDPDLFSPPGPLPAGDETIYCPTPAASTTDVESPSTFTAARVVNLSLDIGDQAVQAVAIGDDLTAAGWVEDEAVFVALGRGGSHFQVRRVDSGSHLSLTFSSANRLHLAYEQEGHIFYRAADQGAHPADVSPIFVDAGQKPKVVVDELNWAHVFYERDGSIFKAKHLFGDQWYPAFVAHGSNATVIPFYNERDIDLWGIPAGSYWFGLFMAAPYNGQIRLFRYLSWFNLWEQVAAFPIPPGEEVTGSIGLDYHAAGADEVWVYASWVTKRPNTAPPMPLYSQPIYEAVNSLYPYQIANPGQIYQGLNAARWRSQGTPFDAGLRQTVAVPDPFGVIHFEAYGLAQTDGPADLNLRLGIDPTGGNIPDSPSVVWSAVNNPSAFTRFTASAPAAGETATLFLHATHNTPDVPATVVWDAAQAHNANLQNGDFEGPFISQSTLTVPEQWSAYYQDSGNSPISGRDVYTVYGAWSSDGGSSWSAPMPVTGNQVVSQGTTGAIGPNVYPVISTATEPPSVTFFTLYESGDPPPGSSSLRFGRPVLTICDLGTTNCSDPPGAPFMPHEVIRPTTGLLLAPDPFDPDRSLLIWEALQTDYESKDVYATYVTVR